MFMLYTSLLKNCMITNNSVLKLTVIISQVQGAKPGKVHLRFLFSLCWSFIPLNILIYLMPPQIDFLSILLQFAAFFFLMLLSLLK